MANAREEQRRVVALYTILVLLIALTGLSVVAAVQNAQKLADNRDTICGSANQTALAFREPSPGESQAHFRARLGAQEFTLNRAAGLDCEDVPGLEGFDVRVERALRDINSQLASVDKTVIVRRDAGPRNAGLRNSQTQSNPARSGGGSPSTPPASSPPSPSPPGGGQPPSNPPGGNPSNNPPPDPPDDDGPVGQILDDVCEITTPLGVCLN